MGIINMSDKLKEDARYLCLCRIVSTDMEIELIWHENEWCYPKTLEKFKSYGKVIKVLKSVNMDGNKK